MANTEYIRNVDRAILNTVFENTVRRVNKCLENGEGHFKRYNFLYSYHQVHRYVFVILYICDNWYVSYALVNCQRAY
jgi:hypothetical protein